MTVKVSSLDEALASFKNVWEKVESGEELGEPIEIVGFENALVSLAASNGF